MKLYSYLKKKKGELFPNKNPFKDGPYGIKSDYLDIYNNAKSQEFNNVVIKCKELGFNIEKEYFDALAFITQVVKKESDINYQHGILIYALLRNYINKNQTEDLCILETGTALGYSSICMSKAIIDSSSKGIINTIDYLPSNKKMYWNCIKDFEGKHTRLELLNDWREELSNIKFLEGKSKKVLKNMDIDRIHFAFLDACPTKKELLFEFIYVAEIQLTGDVIIFDDVTVGLFPGVVEAVKEIENKNSYSIIYFDISKFRSIAIATKK